MIKVHGMVWEDKEKYSTLSMVLIIFTSERNSHIETYGEESCFKFANQ
jgi:hypothetical protein